MGTTLEKKQTREDNSSLDCILSRIQKPNYSIEEISKQLEQLASNYSVTLRELFLMAETEQMNHDDCDKTMTLFSILDSLKVS